MTGMGGVLTREQIERFHRDGYLKFDRVIDDGEVEALRSALDRTIESERRKTDLPSEFAYGHDRTGAEERGTRPIHQFLNMWKIAPEYERVIHSPRITGAMRDLMGAEKVRIWHDQVISKPPGDNGVFAFHHDFYFWPLDHPTMISCWLALDKATPENGCMHVIPGSHRDPRYQQVGCELTEELGLSPAPLGPGEPGSLYDEVRTWDADRAIPVELEAGECMFHHCLNYHMTPRNVTGRQRRGFVIIYMPDGTRYRREQSPHHPCVNGAVMTDGAPMGGDSFPICGDEASRLSFTRLGA